MKRYYEKLKRAICKKRIARYTLREPKPQVKQMYAEELMRQLMSHPEAKAKLMEAYRNVFKGREVPNVTASAVCRV